MRLARTTRRATDRLASRAVEVAWEWSGDPSSRGKTRPRRILWQGKVPVSFTFLIVLPAEVA